MDVRLISDWLLLCTLINYAVLLAWFVAFSVAHEWMFRLHTRWFRLPVEHRRVLGAPPNKIFPGCGQPPA